MTPDRQRQIAIDRACLRFLDALDAGDIDTLAEVWEQAETDAELSQALCELCEAVAEEQEQEQGVPNQD